MEGLFCTSNLGWTLAMKSPTLGHVPTMAQRKEKLSNTETSRRYRERLRQNPQLYQKYKEKQTQLRRQSRARERQRRNRMESSTCGVDNSSFAHTQHPASGQYWNHQTDVFGMPIFFIFFLPHFVLLLLSHLPFSVLPGVVSVRPSDIIVAEHTIQVDTGILEKHAANQELIIQKHWGDETECCGVYPEKQQQSRLKKI